MGGVFVFVIIQDAVLGIGSGLADGAFGFLAEFEVLFAQAGVLLGDFGAAEGDEGFDDLGELIEVGVVVEQFEELGGGEDPCALGERVVTGCQGGGAPPPYRRRVLAGLSQLKSEGGHFFEALGLEDSEGVFGEAALAPGGEVDFVDGFGEVFGFGE